MGRIVATRSVASTLDDVLSPYGLDVIRVGVDRLVQEATNQKAIAVISRSEPEISTKQIQQLGEAGVKVIGRACVGYDGIDLGAAYNTGIAVINAPESTRMAVAELTMAQMMRMVRDIDGAMRLVMKKGWKATKNSESLYEKRLGIVGVGGIGSTVAKMAKLLKTHVYGYDPHLPRYLKERLRPYVDEFVGNLDQLFRRCDIITIHTLLNEETRGMIGDEQFDILRKAKESRAGIGIHRPIYLLNMARGGIVNEEALLKALGDDTVYRAALDVYEKERLPDDSPLRKFSRKHPERLLLTGHIGGSVKPLQDKTGIELGNNLIRYLLTGSATHIVDLGIKHERNKEGEYQLRWDGYHGIVEFISYLSGYINEGFDGIGLDCFGEYRRLPSAETYLLQIHALKGALSAISPRKYTIPYITKRRSKARIVEGIEGTEFSARHPLIRFGSKNYHLARRPSRGTGESLFRVTTCNGSFPKLRVVANEHREGFTVKYYSDKRPRFTNSNLIGIDGYVLVVHHQNKEDCPKGERIETLRLPKGRGLLSVLDLEGPLNEKQMRYLRKSVIKARQFYIDRPINV